MPLALNELSAKMDQPVGLGASYGRAAEGMRTYFTLKLNGSQAGDDLLNDILDLTVENSLHLPDMCTLRIQEGVFADPGRREAFHWSGSDAFTAGTKVEVIGGRSSLDAGPIFVGEVASLEMDISSHGLPTLLVRCYDHSHRLHRGRYSRSFQNMTDADIVSQVCTEAGLTASADATTPVHDWVFQNNQTNWEFLNERAAHAGCRLFGAGDKRMHLKTLAAGPEGPVTLTWGSDLISFRPRLNAASQVSEVSVHGWDPAQKQAIVGTATTPNGLPSTGAPSRQAAMGGFQGDAKMRITDRPVHSQTEAEKIAQSVCDDIGGQYMEAEGLTQWDARILPGKQVKITNVGSRFSGDYTVTATTHVMSVAEGFTTLFSCTGKQPGTVLSALDGSGGAKRTALGGNIVVGIVTNNKDDKNLGRVKVKYPWLSDNDESFWARVVSPMGGPTRGFYFLPEVDDEVLVAFEHGDIRRPYVLGALWNGVDAPVEGNDAAVEGGKVIHRIIKTRIGHTILLDDKDDKGEMKMTTKSGHFLTLNDRDENVTAQTKDGHKVLLDDQNGKIVVVDKTGGNKMTIQSSDNSITIECVGDFSVKATGRVNIEGQAGVTVTTPAQMSIHSDTQMKIDAGVEVAIEGGITDIKGLLVKINS